MTVEIPTSAQIFTPNKSKSSRQSAFSSHRINMNLTNVQKNLTSIQSLYQEKTDLN